jgi:hypothetical protein
VTFCVFLFGEKRQGRKTRHQVFFFVCLQKDEQNILIGIMAKFKDVVEGVGRDGCSRD